MLAWAASPGRADPAAPDATVIPDVPSYIWYHGCGPTSAGMILGYWDAHGFDDLIPGSNDWHANQQAIKDVIASARHVADYALYDGVNDSDPQQWPYDQPYPDMSEVYPGGGHRPDCIADFMKSSWSALGLKYGYSFMDAQDGGMVRYTELCDYDARSYHRPYGQLWEPFTAAIDAGRPVQLFVDTNADGVSDHFVTAIGYDDTPGEEKYACLNTWDHDVHWLEFALAAPGQPWGIFVGTFYEPVPAPGCLTPLALLILACLRRRRLARGPV